MGVQNLYMVTIEESLNQNGTPVLASMRTQNLSTMSRAHFYPQADVMLQLK